MLKVRASYDDFYVYTLLGTIRARDYQLGPFSLFGGPGPQQQHEHGLGLGLRIQPKSPGNW